MHPLESNTQMCIDIDECERIDNICMNGLCENTNGVFRCICDEGRILLLLVAFSKIFSKKISKLRVSDLVSKGSLESIDFKE